MSGAFDLAAWSHERLTRVESALDAWVPSDAPAGLGEAVLSVFRATNCMNRRRAVPV